MGEVQHLDGFEPLTDGEGGAVYPAWRGKGWAVVSLLPDTSAMAPVWLVMNTADGFYAGNRDTGPVQDTLRVCIAVAQVLERWELRLDVRFAPELTAEIAEARRRAQEHERCHERIHDKRNANGDEGEHE